MSYQDYKVSIGVLLVTNISCIIIIAVLCGEIKMLQTQLAEMSDTVRALDEKIGNLGLAQENFHQENLKTNKVVTMENLYILGAITITMAFSILTLSLLGSIGNKMDPNSLVNVTQITADQLSNDIGTQKQVMSMNLKSTLDSINIMNTSLKTLIKNNMAFICSKLEVINQGLINNNINLNSIFGNVPSDGGNEWI